MRARDVQRGGVYLRRGRLVRIVRRLSAGGWTVLGLETGRRSRVKSGRALTPLAGVSPAAYLAAARLADRLIADPSVLVPRVGGLTMADFE